MAWNVWSVNDNAGRAVVVGDGARQFCIEAAERKNASAAHLGGALRFVALPAGEVPELEE